ncbi:DNA polymerase delta subunit 2 [Patellaria atrata CBS 101060]|uniref:DNA-directed DNA polymerase n=1 Tax=Patellaria atrata CBS 101060 TaxID=1346257 RepID=A0A9P4SGZ1_9PEZI|nr:DNA polymerase delta subunit 2 [Patellaria atrata CBS 101060]
MPSIDGADVLLSGPTDTPFPTATRHASSYNPLHTFHLPKGEQKHYQQQFADLYFLRLAQLKEVVEEVAGEDWDMVGGEKARRVDRVLDVRQGELCWVVGTVYMEMPLKPNILDDISKEHWIAAPPPREKYLSPNGGDQKMLEDDSGRLRIIGEFIDSRVLATGAIIAALGTENKDGAFEVIDIKVADLPRQPERWERDEAELAETGKKVKQNRQPAGKIAILSGLSISGELADDLSLDLLTEYLLGESMSGVAQESAAQISRLLIAGNSLANASPILSRDDFAAKKSNKKYGYDSSAYNAAPTEHLDNFLSVLLPSLPITLLPGETDPSNVALPQPPLHPALFPQSRAYANPPVESKEKPGALDSVTNPWEGDIDGWRFLVNGGQPINDVYKYVEGDDRLEMMECLLRWRSNAPTAPDTLWCYPFQDDDPFLVKDCPHVYIVGNQPRFETTVIEGPLGQRVRLIAVPSFRDTGTMVLLDAETLAVDVVNFEVFKPSKDVDMS